MPKMARKRCIPLLGCILSAVLLGTGTGAQAALYKWVDSNGELHFTDMPPADAPPDKVQEVQIKGGGARPGTPPAQLNDALAVLRDAVVDRTRSDSLTDLNAFKQRWGLENGGQGKVEVGGGVLTLTAKADTNLYRTTTSAPVISQSLEGIGPFSLHVSIDYSAENKENSAGILLFDNDMARWLSFNFVANDAVAWKMNDNDGNWKPYTTSRTELMVLYDGSDYYLYYLNNGNWTYLDDFGGHTYQNIGLFAFSWSADAPVTAKFRDVVFKTVAAPETSAPQ